MNNSMKRLKELEGRGNVKINRQTGAVTVARGLEFVPALPSDDPQGRFADEMAAKETLQDLAQLANTFDIAWLEIEVRIKVAKGGTQEAWDRLAAAHAEVLREQLECFESEFSMEKVSIKSAAGKEDADVYVRFDASIFAEAPKAPKGKAKAKP